MQNGSLIGETLSLRLEEGALLSIWLFGAQERHSLGGSHIVQIFRKSGHFLQHDVDQVFQCRQTCTGLAADGMPQLRESKYITR